MLRSLLHLLSGLYVAVLRRRGVQRAQAVRAAPTQQSGYDTNYPFY